MFKKKNIYINIMTKTKKFYKVKLSQGTKRPTVSQNNPENWYKSNESGGILCGSYMVFNGDKKYHNNNICVLDIDFFKKQTEEQIKNNLFIKEFGMDFIEKFKTFTIKTQSRGFHLYFKYEPDLKTCVSGQVRKGLEIDFLSDGRYVVGPGCKVNGNSYEVFINKKIKKIPKKLYNFIKDVLPKDKKETKKKYRSKKNNKSIKNQFSYDIDDNTFNEIILKLPKKYFDSYTEYLKFTTFCKILNKKNEWNNISKNYKNYNYNNNMIIWDKCKTNINMVDHFLKYINKPSAYFKYKKIPTYNEYKPDYIFNRKKLGINEGKPVDIISDILSDHPQCESIIIKSDTGTGKTTSVGMFLEKTQEDFISLVSRVSLGQEQSYKVFNQRFNLNSIFYKDESRFFNTGENIVIQLESMMRLYNMDLEDYVIFLDEYSSILEHLFRSTTLNKHRTLIFEMFRRVLKQAKLIIAVDADINSMCIQFMKEIKKKVIYVKNTYQHNKNVTAYEVDRFEQIVQKIKNSSKYLVCCDSKSRAEKIKYLLNDDSIKLITSDTIEYIDLDLYDKIIISPKVIYGLDCSNLKDVFCCYQSTTISSNQMVQQISRVRNINNMYFNFINKNINQPIYDTLEECKEILKYSDTLSILEFNIKGDAITSELFINYLSMIEYKLDSINSNKFYHFMNILQSRGVKIIKKFTMAAKIDKKKEKELIDMIYDDKLKNIQFYRDQINEYLCVPDDVTEYDEIFIDQFKLLTHWNIVKMFHKFDTSNDISIKIQKDDNDYPVNLTHSTNTKLYFLKLLLEKTEADGIQPTKSLDKKVADEMYIKYKTIFRVRSKKVDFADNNNLCKILNRIYKELFKNYITSKRVGRKKEYKFTINKNMYDYHKKLYDYRTNIIEFVEENNEEDIKEDYVKLLKV